MCHIEIAPVEEAGMTGELMAFDSLLPWDAGLRRGEVVR